LFDDRELEDMGARAAEHGRLDGADRVVALMEELVAERRGASSRVAGRGDLLT